MKKKRIRAISFRKNKSQLRGEKRGKLRISIKDGSNARKGVGDLRRSKYHCSLEQQVSWQVLHEERNKLPGFPMKDGGGRIAIRANGM